MFLCDLVGLQFFCLCSFTLSQREPFDLYAFLRALDAYRGQHNFSAFTPIMGREELFTNKSKNPIKTVKIGEIAEPRLYSTYTNHHS